MMAIVSVDPRRDRAEPADVRPIVGTARSGLPLWVMIAGLIFAGILLFSVLDARRRAASAPPVRAHYDDFARALQPTPSLFIPPAPPIAPPTPSPTLVQTPILPPVVAPPPRIIYVPQPALPAPAYQPPPPPPPRVSNEPVLVIDTGTGIAPTSNTNGPAATAPTDRGEASSATVRATVIRNRATIVGQGTLIPAVLESALDSTRAGPVRALVSGDVRGFDGSRILIPRGSRLFGDYRADLQPGQNRALINWTRLVRPDGVAIGSPASDPLGRAGVRGKVNSHFLERFGAAILQSSLDIGVNLASRLGTGNSAVVVGLPGASQALAQPLTQGAQIRPTLRVRQGTALSVFVARDLDFTAVEGDK